MKRAWLPFLLFWLWPLAAGAENDIARAKEAFKAGATAYAAGDYLTAIQALDAAYAITPLPAIAFSLAQAERRQYFVSRERSHLERAIILFRRYLEQVPVGGRRADTLDALSQLEPLAALQTRSTDARSIPEAASVRRTRVMVTCEVPGARIALDGGTPLPSPLIREVTPGKHHVTVNAQGFDSSERELTAVTGELIVAAVPLRERPSTLAIWSPVGSQLYLDGAYASEGGDGVLLQLPSGRHRLAVAQQGHEVRVRELTLGRGSTQSLRVTLEPTRQRIASRVLFISGGAALGASIVLSAFAIRAEDSAEDFLGKRAHSYVNNSELVAYNLTIGNRNRFRIATAVSLASAAGFFITGLFLHELDQPNLADIFRIPRRSGTLDPGARDSARSQIGLAPTLSADSFGAALQTVF